MKKSLKKVGLLRRYAWIDFWKFKKDFFGGWETEFRERTSQVGRLPIAIKSTSWWFWEGRKRGFRKWELSTQEWKNRESREDVYKVGREKEQNGRKRKGRSSGIFEEAKKNSQVRSLWLLVLPFNFPDWFINVRDYFMMVCVWVISSMTSSIALMVLFG